MFEEEIWKDMVVRNRKGVEVDGIGEKYSISSYGRVWNKDDKVYVSQVLTGKPQYFYVNLTPRYGKRILRRVHNIMGHTFLGEPDDLNMTIDHKDRNKYNNALWNLRWAGRKTQMRNRDCTLLLDCGKPLLKYTDEKKDVMGSSLIYKYFKEGITSEEGLNDVCIMHNLYGSSWNEDIHINGSVYKLRNVTEDLGLDFKETLTLLSKGYSIFNITNNTLIPPPKENIFGYELGGVWYPSLQSLCDSGVANCHIATLSDRLKVMSLEDAVVYNKHLESHGFEYQDVFDTLQGHCKRLGLSYERVSAVRTKWNLTNIEALESPIKRVIKHAINGEIKRNFTWFEHFNINPRVANSKLTKCKSIRVTLEHYGVDTSNMEIYPCDGDIIITSKPL